MGSVLNSSAISLSPLLLPWIGSDNPPLMLPKARSPLENSVTCLSGHISMEDLQSQTSASMDWLSKFTQSAFTLQTPAQFHLEWTFFFKFTFAFASNLTSPRTDSQADYIIIYTIINTMLVSLMSENGQN